MVDLLRKDLNVMYTAYSVCPEKDIILRCDDQGRDDCVEMHRTKQHKTMDTSSMTSKHYEKE